MSNNEINPGHYKGTHNGHPIEVADVMDIFNLDRHQAQAVKYLLRAGKKQSSSYLKDMGKALWWCARSIMAHDGYIDLPPETTTNKIAIGGKTIIRIQPRKLRKKAKK